MASGTSASGVTVVIGVEDGQVVGAAAGSGSTLPATAARATLRAVESLTDHRLTVRAADIVELGDLNVALVAVAIGADVVIGAASVGIRTPAEAFARASLDAINRIVSGASDQMGRIRHAAVYQTAP